MANIDNLSIQISSSADSAAKGIDTLVTQLGRLKSAVSASGDGLDRVSHQLTDIGNAGRGMSNNIAQKLTNLANGLKALQSVGKVSISSTIGKGIESINQALNSLNVNNLPKIERFANALKALSGMGDIRISSTIAKEMTNIGAAAELLKDVDFTGVKNLADALKQFQGMQDVKIPKISGGAAAAAAAEAAGAADVVEDTMDSVPPSEVEAENSTRSFGDALKGLAQKLNGAIGPVNGFKGTVKGLWGVLKGAVGGVLGFVGGIARIAKYRFIRALIKDLVQSFKDLYGYSDKFGTGFADAMDKITTSTTYFRNSLAAMVAPLVEMLAPALDFIIDKVVDVLNWFNQLFAALSGASTYTAARKVERAWSSTFNNTTNSARQAQKELKRTILGFDEINKLNDANSSRSGGGNGNSPYSNGYQLMFEERPIESGFTGFSNAIENAMEGMLSRITMIVSGASLALGAILLFSGVNPPLGLSLMVAGASGLVSIIGMNWNGLSADVKLVIGAIETALGGALLAIGAILAFSGTNIPLGIAMIVAGAASIAAAVGLNWDLITGKVRVSARGVAGAISAASLALGAILAFTGVNVPLGIGLIAAGATGTIATLNWDAVKELLKGPIGAAEEIVSGALLVMGIIAIMTSHVAVGLGLLAAGVAGMSVFAFVNKDAISQVLSDPVGRGIAFVAGASLVMGVVALVSGHAALGFALLASGAATLSAFAFINNDGLKEVLVGPIGTATLFVAAAALVMGVVALITAHTALGIGLLATGVATLSAFAFINKDAVKAVLKDPIGSAVAYVGAASLVMGVIALISGHAALGFGLLATGVGALSAFAFVNNNAVKDVLKGPIGTAVAFVGAASLVMGVIALMAAHPALGFALLATGVSALSAFAFINNDAFAKALSDPVGRAIAYVGAASLAMGVIAIIGGHPGLGLALLATGVATLSAFAFINNDAVKDIMKGPIGSAVAYVGGASLVMGVIALMSAHPALGFALLASGAASISAFAFMNKDAITEALSDPIGRAIAFVGAASFVVGVIALISGHPALGLALLAGGVATLNAFAFINNEAVKQAMEGPIGSAVALISGASLVMGVIAMMSAHPALGFALMAAGVAGLNAFAFINKEAVAAAMSEPINKAIAIVAGASLVMGVVALVAGNATLGFALLATGVGTLTAFAFVNNNAVAEALSGPVGLAVGVVSGAALLLGIVAMVTGNIPLGLALLLSGAAGLAESISANWDNLKQFGADAVASVKEGWDSGNFFSLIIHPLISDGEETPTLPGGVQANATQWSNDLDVGMLQSYIQTILDPGVDVDVRVMLIKDLWDTVNKWVYDNMGGEEIEAKVALVKQWFGGVLNSLGLSNLSTIVSVGAQTIWGYWHKSFLSWFNLNNLKTNVSVDGKTRWGQQNRSFLSWFGLDKLKTNVNVDAYTPWQYFGRSFLSWIGADKLKTTVDVSYKASGGISRASNRNMTKAKGGVFSGTMWSDIPQYAGGTSSAHGSLFIAGEAGPEIVGHIGGTTEVLNRSQLAATMYSAVQAAMAPASANFAAAATQMYKGVDGMNGEDMETLMEMVRQTNDATMRQNELLREQNDYLRQLNDKDFTAEITTSGISRAQARANRRAGTTVIPVGT